MVCEQVKLLQRGVRSEEAALVMHKYKLVRLLNLSYLSEDL